MDRQCNNKGGFTVANVEFICKIADSTKTRTDSQYYIGERGIRFKSVFMVASKVYINSGPFLFFERRFFLFHPNNLNKFESIKLFWAVIFQT
jgi:hypothetical protein